MLKYCPKCRQTKETTTDFYRSNYQSGGFNSYCKKCSYKRHNKWRKQNLPKMREASRKWRNEHPREAKDHILRSHRGIPLGTYDRLFAAQKGCCAICGTNKPNGRGDFHIDHCHATGSIRGLLCHGCNVGIGSLKHDIAILRQAIDYLTQK